MKTLLLGITVIASMSSFTAMANSNWIEINPVQTHPEVVFEAGEHVMLETSATIRMGTKSYNEEAKLQLINKLVSTQHCEGEEDQVSVNVTDMSCFEVKEKRGSYSKPIKMQKCEVTVVAKCLR